ncbi:helix-turn-helix domain-containing protein [Flindersiella endophytica]
MKVKRSIGELGDYLREQRRHAELSLRQLADLTGVSNPYLSQIERGLRKPSAEVLNQLAKALRVSAEALYVRAGLLDPAEDGDTSELPAVEAAIRADPVLTSRQKRVLLDIYTAFHRESEQQDVPDPAQED